MPTGPSNESVPIGILLKNFSRFSFLLISDHKKPSSKSSAFIEEKRQLRSDVKDLKPPETIGEKRNEASTRPLILEVGLYVTSDLKDAFYDQLHVNELPGGDIFKSTLLTNYIKGVSERFHAF